LNANSLNPAPVHRVLVIEDNAHTAYLLQFMLQRVGYDVIVAVNGRDAMSVIENLTPVDAILLDLMLPYVSGYQIIRELKENTRWQHVPVIVLSGKVLEQDIVKALDLGANDYVAKPFKPQELLARVRRLINSSAQRTLQA
jgi:DNA-binding response OmpR family regulator